MGYFGNVIFFSEMRNSIYNNIAFLTPYFHLYTSLFKYYMKICLPLQRLGELWIRKPWEFSFPNLIPLFFL